MSGQAPTKALFMRLAQAIYILSNIYKGLRKQLLPQALIFIKTRLSMTLISPLTA